MRSEGSIFSFPWISCTQCFRMLSDISSRPYEYQEMIVQIGVISVSVQYLVINC